MTDLHQSILLLLLTSTVFGVHLNTPFQVAYPGVVGLTDEDVGFSSTNRKCDNASSACKSTPGRPLAPKDVPRQASSSSPSTSCHGNPTLSGGKGVGGPLALEESTFGNSGVQNDAASRDMTLEDLAKTTDVADLAEKQGVDQSDNRREHTEGGGDRTGTRTEPEEGGRTQEMADTDTRRDSRGTRGIGQKENSTKWAWNRRGTDECSLYFRSDSGCEGDRMPSPSRRTSTASNGSTGGKGKRTVYLGRTQAFSLRRIESSLSVDARGFGLSGVSAAAIGED